MREKYEDLGFDADGRKYVDAVFTLREAGFNKNEIMQLRNGKKKNGWFSFELPNGNILRIEQKTGKIENEADIKKIHAVLNRDRLLKKKAELRKILVNKCKVAGISLSEKEAKKIADTLHYDNEYKMEVMCYGYAIKGRVLQDLLEPDSKLSKNVADQLTIKFIVDWALYKAKMHKEKWKHDDLGYIESADVQKISTYTSEDGIVHVHVHENANVKNDKTGVALKCHIRILGRYCKDSSTWCEELEDCFENYLYNRRLIDSIALEDITLDLTSLDSLHEKYVRNIQKALHEVSVDDLKQIKNADYDVYRIIYLLGGCNIRGNAKMFGCEYLRRVPAKKIVFVGTYKGMHYRYNFEENYFYMGRDERESIPVSKFIFLKKLVRTWKKKNEELSEKGEEKNGTYRMHMLGFTGDYYCGKVVLLDLNDKIVDEIEVSNSRLKPRTSSQKNDKDSH